MTLASRFGSSTGSKISCGDLIRNDPEIVYDCLYQLEARDDRIHFCDSRYLDEDEMIVILGCDMARNALYVLTTDGPGWIEVRET